MEAQFDRFRIGWLRIPFSPSKAAREGGLKGILTTTFLDDSLRVSRGHLGNVFVFVRKGASRV